MHRILQRSAQRRQAGSAGRAMAIMSVLPHRDHRGGPNTREHALPRAQAHTAESWVSPAPERLQLQRKKEAMSLRWAAHKKATAAVAENQQKQSARLRRRQSNRHAAGLGAPGAGMSSRWAETRAREALGMSCSVGRSPMPPPAPAPQPEELALDAATRRFLTRQRGHSATPLHTPPPPPQPAGPPRPSPLQQQQGEETARQHIATVDATDEVIRTYIDSQKELAKVLDSASQTLAKSQVQEDKGIVADLWQQQCGDSERVQAQLLQGISGQTADRQRTSLDSKTTSVAGHFTFGIASHLDCDTQQLLATQVAREKQMERSKVAHELATLQSQLESALAERDALSERVRECEAAALAAAKENQQLKQQLVTTKSTQQVAPLLQEDDAHLRWLKLRCVPPEPEGCT